jgi:hypothetical protein
LQCHLTAVRLADDPRYEALSYYWGSKEMVQELRCDESAVIHITQNCADALYQLRGEAEDRVLWIDAISINQDDTTKNDEKAEQIRIMDQIYKLAWRVVVWLGVADDLTKLAFTRAQHLAKIEMDEVQETWRNGRATIAPFDKAWNSFDRLFSRHWFTRIWVIQEVCLNEQVDVQCGEHKITWDELDCAVDLAHVADHLPAHNALFAFRRDFISGPRSKIADLVVRFQGQQATDFRDKIFALRGLLDSGDMLDVGIDYGINKSELYKSWVCACLNKTSSLDLIGSVDTSLRQTLPKGHTDYLPSWVPDLAQKRTCLSLAYHQLFSSHARHYAASRNSYRCQFTKDSIDKGVLDTNGHLVSRVAKLSLPAGGANIKPRKFLPLKQSSINDWLNEARTKLFWQLDWERISKVREGGMYYNGETLEDAYWQTLCAGCSDNDREEVKQEFQKFDKDMQSLSFLHRLGASSSRSVVDFLVLSLFVRRYILPIPKSKGWPFTERMSFAQGRRTGVLHNGFIGLFPSQSRVDDEVWILDGGKVPYLIRHDEVCNTWSLVGETYVHGIMQGEASDDQGRTTIQLS